MIYLAADHRGFGLKQKVIQWLRQWGEPGDDLGNSQHDSQDDYVDFAEKVARKVALGQGRGIVICGSGQGVCLVANKFPGVRAIVAWSPDIARQGREHEDANILSLPADYLSDEEAEKIVKVWLDTPFSPEPRHRRRLRKIKRLEKEFDRGNLKPKDQR